MFYFEMFLFGFGPLILTSALVAESLLILSNRKNILLYGREGFYYISALAILLILIVLVGMGINNELSPALFLVSFTLYFIDLVFSSLLGAVTGNLSFNASKPSTINE